MVFGVAPSVVVAGIVGIAVAAVAVGAPALVPVVETKVGDSLGEVTCWGEQRFSPRFEARSAADDCHDSRQWMTGECFPLA